MIAPLQLLDYEVRALNYERLFLSAQEAGDGDAEQSPGVAMSFEMDSQWDEKRKAQCLTLTVGFNEEEMPEDLPDDLQHRGRIGVTGWFAWIDEEASDRENATRLLLVNGLSILYGIARVRIAELTAPVADSAAERLLLPSLSFLPIVEDWMESGEETSEAAAGKADEDTLRSEV